MLKLLNYFDLREKDMEARYELISKNLEDIKATIEGTSRDGLVELEDFVIMSQQDNEEIIKNAKYDLPKKVELYNKTYLAEKIHEFIIEFVNKIEVEWNATLGIVEVIDYWKNYDGKGVTYSAYDSTARLLGLIKYKGYDNCVKVLVVHEYLKSANKDFGHDHLYTRYLAEVHNMVIDQMHKLDNPEPAEEA